MNLNETYLNDLNSETEWGKSKVRYIENWRAIKPFSKTEKFIDIAEEIYSGRNVWFISDIHFGHTNIIKYCNRPFANATEMNEQIIRNLQDTVGQDDIIIFVGDIAFTSTEQANSYLSRIPGYKILVIGNHDFHKRVLRELNFDEIHLCHNFQHNNIDYALTHYPMNNLPLPWINIHGHIHDKHLDTLQHINVSIEVLNYKPISFTDLQKIAETRVNSMEV